MNQVMLDWETMGNKPNAAVMALGACFFDTATGQIGEIFYSEISLQSSVALGLDIDASTVLWWMQQSDEARIKFKLNGDENTPTVSKALIEFSDWLKQHAEGDVELWGNGATFDNVIAANVFDKLSLDLPWKFCNDRCYRTVKSIYKDVPYVFKGVKHFALDDAISQAKHLCAIAQKHKILGVV